MTKEERETEREGGERGRKGGREKERVGAVDRASQQRRKFKERYILVGGVYEADE